MNESARQILGSLGMDERNHRALPLLPLVQVAWADGEIQSSEAELMMRLARDSYQLCPDGILMLQNWLRFRPSSDYVERGQRALVTLAHGDQEVFDKGVLDDVLCLCLDVAKAAGGYFGYHTISVEETKAIQRIADSLGVEANKHWVLPRDPTFIPVDADHLAHGPEVEVAVLAPKLEDPLAYAIFGDFTGNEQMATLGPNSAVRIGRAEGSGVQITFDPAVSRMHCELVAEGDDVYLVDLDSTCGTFVNGQRIAKRRLLGRERVQVGRTEFFIRLRES